MMCLGVDFFVVYPILSFSSSWICRFRSFAKFEEVSAIITLNAFSVLPFFFFPSGLQWCKCLLFCFLVLGISVLKSGHFGYVMILWILFKCFRLAGITLAWERGSIILLLPTGNKSPDFLLSLQRYLRKGGPHHCWAG